MSNDSSVEPTPAEEIISAKLALEELQKDVDQIFKEINNSTPVFQQKQKSRIDLKLRRKWNVKNDRINYGKVKRCLRF